MRIHHPDCLLALLALVASGPCAPALAQSTEAEPPAWADGVEAQLGLELHPGPGAALHYAHALYPRWLLGGELGVSWREDGPSFDRLLVPGHASVFGRYLVGSFAQADVGLTALVFHNTDDVVCDEPMDRDNCGVFYGLDVAVSLGYRYVFLTTRLRSGFAVYEDDSTTWGAIYTPLTLRAVASF